MTTLTTAMCVASVITVCAFIDFNNLKRLKKDHIRMAELAGEMIGKYNLSDNQKRFLKSCLSDVCQWWFMPFAVVVLPLVLLSILLRRPIGLPNELRELRDYPEFKEFKSLHMLTLTSSNSFFTLVFAALVTLLLAPVLLLRGLKASLRIGEVALYRTSPRFMAHN